MQRVVQGMQVDLRGATILRDQISALTINLKLTVV